MVTSVDYFKKFINSEVLKIKEFLIEYFDENRSGYYLFIS